MSVGISESEEGKPYSVYDNPDHVEIEGDVDGFATVFHNGGTVLVMPAGPFVWLRFSLAKALETFEVSFCIE